MLAEVRPPTTALQRIDRLLEREILRLRARYQLSLDEFRGLYISDEQVDRLVAAQRDAPQTAPAAPPFSTLSTPLTQGLSVTEARWRHLAEEFALDDVELDLMLIAIAPDIDLKYETLFAYLNNDITRKWPTIDLARRLLVDTGTTPHEVSCALMAESPLRHFGLIEMLSSPSGAALPLHAGFKLHGSVIAFLLGYPLCRPAPPLPGATLGGPSAASYARIVNTRDAPVLLLLGKDSEGRLVFAQQLADELKLPLRSVDLAQLRRESKSPQEFMARIELEQRLELSVIRIENLSAILDAERRIPNDCQGLCAALRGPLLIESEEEDPWRSLIGSRRVLKIVFSLPDQRARINLWQKVTCLEARPLSRAECAALADRYALTGRQIRDAAATAGDLAILNSSTTTNFELMHAAAAMQCESAIGRLGNLVRSRCGWDDLILSPEAKSHLKDVAAAIRLRHVVYTEWGFGARDSAGSGIKALFAGPSGTGKTMAAGIIARELGLSLFRIDLSTIVSKYIGETEKNLNRIFDAARAGNAMLFFDEADALFGKRSEVKDAHDRYANIEVSYLLQKLEEHDGAVILASNLRRNIDDAFARRLQYVVEFQKPDLVQREKLWRAVFGSDAPLADNVDFGFLAKQFEMAGGDMRNVALEAAFQAAQSGRAIGMQEIVRSLARQLSKEGKMPSSSVFQGYSALLRDATEAVE
jgi:hypothetical protein